MRLSLGQTGRVSSASSSTCRVKLPGQGSHDDPLPRLRSQSDSMGEVGFPPTRTVANGRFHDHL